MNTLFYVGHCVDCNRIPLFFHTHNDRQDWASEHQARTAHRIHTWLEVK